MPCVVNVIYFWLVLSGILVVENHQSNLYNTNRSRNTVLYYDCLRYTVSNEYTFLIDWKRSETPFHIISYCRRPVADEMEDNGLAEGPHSSFRFHQLKRMNVTSKDLTMWSAPFDLAEDYQDYCDTTNLVLGEQVWNNCSDGSFGVHCQYSIYSNFKFPHLVYMLFTEKVNPSWNELFSLRSTRLICYTQLNCGHCLDWREICDGKVDCLIDGLDEQNCFALEMNECADDEYRCHNGMCVPESFLDDYPYNPDCLDSSDEQLYEDQSFRAVGYKNCYQDPAFRCEESHHPFHLLNYPCGDGQTTFLFQTICINNQDKMHFEALFSFAQNTGLPFDCWLVLYCATSLGSRGSGQCRIFCKLLLCSYDLRAKCHSAIVFFPQRIILHDHIRFAYVVNTTIQRRLWQQPPLPDYVCYTASRCPFLIPKLHINGSACIPTTELKINASYEIDQFFRACPIAYRQDNLTGFLSESLFQCPNTTKFISKHRLLDGIHDCYGGMDEYNNVSTCELNLKHRFKCQSENKCISQIALHNYIPDCSNGEDEIRIKKVLLSFQKVCDGFRNIRQVLIDGQNETDETNCEEWPCDNIYTRCDGAWACLNGADESKCNIRLCPYDSVLCISPSNFTNICLPISRANDGVIDCLGASDERSYCRTLGGQIYPYRCWNSSICISTDEVCVGNTCSSDNVRSQCTNKDLLNMLDMLGNDVDSAVEPKRPYFRIREALQLSQLGRIIEESPSLRRTFERHLMSYKATELVSAPTRLDFWICNRGVPIIVQSETKYRCFCPPSYYGSHCQFQSQRVSLTLQLRKICVSSCFGVFGVLVTLFDNEGTTHSQEQILYVPTVRCHDKFNMYLLYNQRKKSLEKVYTIRVDIYNRLDESYHASWMFPIQFAFLPVNRISVLLTIPLIPVTSRCSKACVHGQCFVYVNTGKEFCLCNPGWTGEQCTIAVNCDCSSDSLCLGVIHNRSTCLYPLHKFGPRCLLRSARQPEFYSKEPILCISTDETPHIDCLHRHRFFGDYSGRNGTPQFEVSFSHLPVPQAVFVHFIIVDNESEPRRISITVRIKLDKDEGILPIPTLDFHLLFVQIQQEYYLPIIRSEGFAWSVRRRIIIKPSYHCPSIVELVDTRILAYPLLRRVKYYHRICRQRSDLSCFHDKETFMCLCIAARHANCFHFDFNATYDYVESHGCENGATPLGDSKCPGWVMCICPDCFYGSKCQFTTKGSSLSLDAILGYSIRSHLPLNGQLISVKISIAFTVFMFPIGLINGVTSSMTFRVKALRETGCGYYLFTSSIISLLIVIIFSLKFIFFLLTQMSIIVNHSFLYINCILIDYLLRSLLAISDWLNVSIAIERTLVAIQGVNFNKTKSCRVAQQAIFLIIILVFGSIVHDPIHRQLINDEEDERIWCIVRYDNFELDLFNSTINVIHSILPFLITLLLAFIIIIIVTRQRASVQKQLSYKQHLREQWRHHRHLIISPVLLVLLAIPRLIISFLSGCMKSVRDPGLFLTGYFISFIPSLLTYFIYILPSKTYKKQFNTLMTQYGITLRRIFIRTE